MENNEIIQIINKLRKFTHNPNEYYLNEDMRKLIKGKKYYSLYDMYYICRKCCVIEPKHELMEVFSKATKNYAIKRIISTIKFFVHNDILKFEEIEQKILRNIIPNVKTCNNIEGLLNAIYEQHCSVEYAFDFIGRNIVWAGTIEGPEYWCKLHDTIKREYFYAIIQKPMNIINKNALFEIMI